MFAHTKTTRKGTLNLQGGIFMFVKHSSHSALKHRCISAAECVLSEAVIQSGLEGFHRDSSVPVKRLHLVYRFLPIMPSHTTAECASNHRPHPLGSICSINSRNAKSKFQKKILQKKVHLHSTETKNFSSIQEPRWKIQIHATTKIHSSHMACFYVLLGHTSFPLGVEFLFTHSKAS